jgi:hypothetical protein
MGFQITGKLLSSCKGIIADQEADLQMVESRTRDIGSGPILQQVVLIPPVNTMQKDRYSSEKMAAEI